MKAIALDGLFPPEMVRAACDWWPVPSWPGWVNYDPKYECKRASNLTDGLPPACSIMLARMAMLPVSQWFGVAALLPDLSLWGAGLYDMPAGGGLGRHLDADTHKRLGLRRELSAVLWVHDEWRPDWGGEVCLDGGLTVLPMSGRFLAFQCGQEWHEVKPVSCPAGVTRKALAMFWYAPVAGDGRRPRAVFAGHPER